MNAPDRDKGQTDKQTNGQSDKRTCLFVRLFVCLLDGVWHYINITIHTSSQNQPGNCPLLSWAMRILYILPMLPSDICTQDSDHCNILTRKSLTK